MRLINPEIRPENTNYCNASCTICSHDVMKRRKGFMDMTLFKSIVDQGKAMGAELISPFGFGEPLIDKQLEERISYCTESGLDTFITTNGSLLTWDRAFGLLNAGLSHLRFSVHGIKKNAYEDVHRGLKFNTVMTNIISALYLKKFFPGVIISVTVIPLHGEKIEDIRKFWETNIDFLEIWRPHNWASAKGYRKKTSNRKKTCGRPERGPLQIQWDGNVIPCCFITDQEITLGNAYEQTLEEILKGEPYRVLRERHAKGDLKGLPCENCDQLNIEQENPLLYSSRDETRSVGKTSSIKFKI